MTGDPRLKRLLDQGFKCASCKETHRGIFDVAFSSPMYWAGSQEKQPDEAVKAALSEGCDILTKNFCLDGEHRFVRCVIPFSIHNSSETFAFGVWGSLSTQAFRQYLDDFFAPAAGFIQPAFSWLSNRLPGCEERSVKCRLHPQPRPDRPILEIGEDNHPFFRAQKEGLSVDRLLEIYRLTGHDMRDVTT